LSLRLELEPLTLSALDFFGEIADALGSVEFHAADTTAVECADWCALNVS